MYVWRQQTVASVNAFHAFLRCRCPQLHHSKTGHRIYLNYIRIIYKLYSIIYVYIYQHILYKQNYQYYVPTITLVSLRCSALSCHFNINKLHLYKQVLKLICTCISMQMYVCMYICKYKLFSFRSFSFMGVASNVLRHFFPMNTISTLIFYYCLCIYVSMYIFTHLLLCLQVMRVVC